MPDKAAPVATDRSAIGMTEPFSAAANAQAEIPGGRITITCILRCTAPENKVDLLDIGSAGGPDAGELRMRVGIKLSSRRSLERNSAGEHLEEDASHRIDVRASADCSRVKLLWGHIVDRSHPLAGVGKPSIRCGFTR